MEYHQLNEDEALDYVLNMTHYGEVYTFEDAEDIYEMYIKDNESLEKTTKTFNQYEFYTALNMMVNDYDRVVAEEQTLAELAYAFLIDEDAPEFKLHRYLVAMSGEGENE
jgi:hypothetical protein